jgi:molybdopterin synthase catalytic subunit
MITITDKPIHPEDVIAEAKTLDSGCVVTYVGLIRNTSNGKKVKSVEYIDANGKAQSRLEKLAADIKKKFPVNEVALCHRVGKLKAGDINIVFAISAGHRQEGFLASQYAVDRFKETLPTKKIETYLDGTTCSAV